MDKKRIIYKEILIKKFIFQKIYFQLEACVVGFL
jgi:hypothetical protein